MDTATLPRGRVALSFGYLNVRSGPSKSARVVGVAGDTAQIPVECQVVGQRVSGTYGTSSLWDRIGAGQYIARVFVANPPGVRLPRC